MNSKREQLCAACGVPIASCIRCRATKMNKPWRLLGLAAPGWDVRVLEREWREWITEAPRNPDAAFIGFCRKVYQKRGRP